MPAPNILRNKTIWIDFDNSPHIPFFSPIIRELRNQGYKVVLSARNAYQVYELADRMHFEYTKIGKHYGKQKVWKVLGTCLRTLQLFPFLLRHRPDMAVSHGSRGQILACRLLGVPTLSIQDYEFARSIGVLGPQWLMIPEVIPESSLAGAVKVKAILKYPGIKEDVYAPEFTPDESIGRALGLSDLDLVVTLRPPATEAHYHNPESDVLYLEAVRYVSEVPEARIVLLPRNPRQAESARKTWEDLLKTRKMIIPDRVLDGLNLIWHSDLVISGGGTMNREAAALGVPVYSIFRGPTGAVDQYLARANRLVMIESVEQVRSKIKLSRRRRSATAHCQSGITLHTIVGQIVNLVQGDHKRTVLRSSDEISVSAGK